VADSQFLQDLVGGTSGTGAVKVDEAMRKQLKAQPSDRMGGDVVKRTVRLFLAVLLKHLGLVDKARLLADQPSTALTNELLDVWKRGQSFHTWIVTSRSSFVQTHEAKQTEMKARGKPMAARTPTQSWEMPCRCAVLPA